LKYEISIFFDTSALRQLGWNAAPLSSVLQLSKAGLVEVYLPELVVEERRTQWADTPQQALIAARAALKTLAEDPILPTHHVEEVKRALEATSRLDIEAMSSASIEAFITSNRINKLPLTFEQSQAAWKAYFSGSAPHRKPKNRDDIPDAHIFEAGKALLERTGLVHFVCADKRLASAFQLLSGARVYENLEDLFEQGVLQEPTRLWSRDQKWRQIQHLAPLDKIQAELRERLEGDLTDDLSDLDFDDEALPGDRPAYILTASGGELISIENPDDWGGGIMSFAVEFECDASIELKVSREEALELPTWLEVDWAGDHTASLIGHVRLKIEATVDVEVDLDNVARRLTPLLSRAEFDDLRVYIIEAS
jgi:hypothetical protein